MSALYPSAVTGAELVAALAKANTAAQINSATDIGAALADGDELPVYDLSATADRKSALSRFWTYVLEKLAAHTSGVGIGTTATALLHLKAGTAAANTAPLKFTSGPLLATPEAGSMEFYDGRWYLTGTAKQRVIDRTGGVIVATTTVANTSVETTLWTESLSANAMKAGRVYDLHCDGACSNATNGDDLTLNVYLGSTLVATLTPNIQTFSDTHWEIEAHFTIRTIGASGTFSGCTEIVIGTVDASLSNLGSIDTTQGNSITLKAKWNNAKTGNTISIYQGWLSLKN